MKGGVQSEKNLYYDDKIEALQRIFGTENVSIDSKFVAVGNTTYPIINDVIVVSPPSQWTESVKRALGRETNYAEEESGTFSEAVQYSYGEEWRRYDAILQDHARDFSLYFDLIDFDALRNSFVCDLGCGNGRWSFFLKDICKQIVLVDFSDAIFVARKNLLGANNCLFFMGNLQALPFEDDFADFLVCLGVLHHLPTPCLSEARRLKRFAPKLLIYLYYALDNRPVYFYAGLKIVTTLRYLLSKVRSPIVRKLIARTVILLVYLPFIQLGRLLAGLGLGNYVPLYEFYRDSSLPRIEQDVYDRFFTSIEQRVTRRDILKLRDTFSEVVISNKLPYWHFLCQR